MTKTHDLKALAEAGQALPPTPTRAQLLEAVARAYEAKPDARFGTLYNVEHVPIEQLRAMSTSGTVLELAVDTLNRTGTPTTSNVGSLMDNLELSVSEVNNLACYCHNGKEMTGAAAAERFRALAQPSIPRAGVLGRLHGLLFG